MKRRIFEECETNNTRLDIKSTMYPLNEDFSETWMYQNKKHKLVTIPNAFA
jgi:hypothetical protein